MHFKNVFLGCGLPNLHVLGFLYPKELSWMHLCFFSRLRLTFLVNYTMEFMLIFDLSDIAFIHMFHYVSFCYMYTFYCKILLSMIKDF